MHITTLLKSLCFHCFIWQKTQKYLLPYHNTTEQLYSPGWESPQFIINIQLNKKYFVWFLLFLWCSISRLVLSFVLQRWCCQIKNISFNCHYTSSVSCWAVSDFCANHDIAWECQCSSGFDTIFNRSNVTLSGFDRFDHFTSWHASVPTSLQSQASKYTWDKMKVVACIVRLEKVIISDCYNCSSPTLMVLNPEKTE